MGYYQIEIAPEDKYKTAFVTPYGHFEFERMPFGLKNAPRVFQKAMLGILGHLKFVIVFLDDVLIHSPDLSTHHDYLSRSIAFYWIKH
jgi:putative transposase